VQANGLNAAGLVVGVAWRGGDGGPRGPMCAFLWDEDQIAELGVLGEERSSACAISDRRQVVGQFRNAEGRFLGFLWENGKTKGLAALDGRLSAATAVNNRGEAVGISTAAGRHEIACLWDVGGAPTDLGVLPGHEGSRANGINDRGLIVGVSGPGDSPGPDAQAVVWRDGVIHALAGACSVAMAVNAAGQIIGSALGGHACLWQDGAVYNLGSLPGHTASTASAINDAGDAAGSSGMGRCSDSRAALWRRGQVYDLNDLIPPDSGWVLQGASGINQRGQISGYGLRNGHRRSFLLSPVAP